MAHHSTLTISPSSSIPAIHVQSNGSPASNSSLSPSPISPHNSLASLSRNTSVISSSSSSSSSSSLVLAAPLRPRPIRTFSAQSNGNSRATSPGSPTTPRTRAPNYLQRQLGIAQSSLERDTLPVGDGSGALTPSGHGARTPQNRSRSNSAVRRMHSPDDFEFGDILGEGSYSTVFSAIHKRTGNVYALKVLDKHHLQRVNKVKYAYVEKDSLAKLSSVGHPGLVRLHWAFSDTTSLYFVLDKANNGELMTKINNLGSLSLECARFYTAQMIDVICWMHELGVLHRDMKPENVLLDDDMRIKITDFGTARIIEKDDDEATRTASFVGSPGYISPELLKSHACGKSADLWAIGCILFQIISGSQPFKALTTYLSLEKTKRVDYTFPPGFDPVARDLVENLLVAEPTARLGDPARGGVPALRAHPFFDSIVWSTLWTSTPPPLESGLVKRERPASGGDDGDEAAAGIGAAWDALLRDLSEDEMDRADDEDDDDGTVGDPHEVVESLHPVGLQEHPTMEDSITPTLSGVPATTPPLPPPKDIPPTTPDNRSTATPKHSSLGLLLPNKSDGPLQPKQHNRGGSFSSGTSSEGSPLDPHSRNGMPSTRRRRSTNTRRRRPSRVVNVHPQVGASVIARDMLLEGVSTSVPVPVESPASPKDCPVQAQGPIASVSEMVVPVPTSPSHPEAVLLSPDAPLVPLVSGISNPSSAGSSEAHSVKEDRWNHLLLPTEKTVFSSLIRTRRRSILPARLKPRILVLTDTPRLLCLKEDPIEGAQSGRIRIKSEVVFEPRLARFIAKPELGEARSKAAAVKDVIVPETNVPVSGKSIFPRSRTISGVRSGAAASASDALSNLLRGVEGKGDRAFVIQTIGKSYNYVADDQTLASHWVREIKSTQDMRRTSVT